MRRVRIRDVQFFERDIRFRLPFRFGAATLTGGPQANVRVLLETGERTESWGCAAEVISPKWFDKNPELSDDENLEQLRTSVIEASRLYLAEERFLAPYELFEAVYPTQVSVCAKLGLNGLIAGYGPALLDRAVVDALLRLKQVSFYDGVRANLIGLRGGGLIADLMDWDFGSFLADLQPLDSIQARHTVGLVDPILSSDIPRNERVGDGLPQSLEEVLEFYGHRYFKLKLCGKVEADIERLSRIAGVLDRIPESYYVTLDGNEQYICLDQVVELWEAAKLEPRLSRMIQSALFLEQPISRSQALATSVAGLSSKIPFVIDESDSSLNVFVEARALGYSGVTSKSCKGFYKSLINLARCRRWNQETGGTRFFMSAEDLTIQAGVSLQQDSALVSLLGIGHAERNGHYFGKGMSEFPLEEQDRFLAAHPDLYCRVGQTVRVRIADGALQIGSLGCPGFALGAEPDWNSMSETAVLSRG